MIGELRICKRAGFRVLRFWNGEVLQGTEGVIQEISRMLSAGDQSAK
jgi:very-short-patch-repair endonuclease